MGVIREEASSAKYYCNRVRGLMKLNVSTTAHGAVGKLSVDMPNLIIHFAFNLF